MWFGENMQPNFATHEMNSRRHDVWDSELADSILERGMVTGVAGEPWMQFSESFTFPLRAITWGSRCRAFYKAPCDNNVFVAVVSYVNCVVCMYYVISRQGSR